LRRPSPWPARRRLASILVALAVAACSPGMGSTPDETGEPAVRVAAASDLRFAMDDLIAGYQDEHPGARVEATYGSSGNFLAQISAGAPFDVFFSADIEYPRTLEEQGHAAAGSTRPYAIGQIVVWIPSDSSLDIEGRGIEVLTDPAAERVSIANPAHAPYGRAAVAAMQAAGIHEAVELKLVLGENVSQAAQFVESGNADAGIIALSLAVAPNLLERGRYVIVPNETYPRLEQGVAVLRGARDPGAAERFVDFVLGPEGRAVLDRFGFLMPGR
jgi:molybdate transport system substrate-binding protein